jgi:hypothetical protein
LVVVSVLLEAARERVRVLFLVPVFGADERRFDIRLLRDAAFVPVLDLLRALVLRFVPAAPVDLPRDDTDLPRVPPAFARLLLALVPRPPAAFARPPVFVLPPSPCGLRRRERRVPARELFALRVVRRRAGCARAPGSDMLIPASANSISKSPMSAIFADWRFADPDFRAIAVSLKFTRQCKETPQA